MRVISIEAADITLVEVKTTNQCSPTPHCKVHGAMNKITVNEDGGGGGGVFGVLYLLYQ
jgi:hypothetical protein